VLKGRVDNSPSNQIPPNTKFTMAKQLAVTVCAVFILALVAQGTHVDINKNVAEDRVITQVVKLLQDMLSNSKLEGDEERVAYAKYKCYCDTNEAEKKPEIEDLAQMIGLLESKIEELKASTGLQTQVVAGLDADIADNQDATNKANALREKENNAFVAFSDDMTSAIDSMKEAINTLAEVGADQTMEKAAQGHMQYMAGYKGGSLLKLQDTIKKALLASSFALDSSKMTAMNSFLQAPFTGSYSAQSGEVVGILKNMRDTFTRNLNQARLKEAAAQDAHTKFLEAMSAAFTELDNSNDAKQGDLASNDAALGKAKERLEAAEQAKAAAEEFLEQLLEMCAAKAKEYSERNMLRAQEQAAISEAIAILNSDAAFETFGTVKATSKEAKSFLQLKTINTHSPEQDVRRQTARNLRQSKAWTKSIFLAKVASLLQAENPFGVVIAEIEKMLALLAKEDASDNEKFEWCNNEREENKKTLAEKISQIETLEADIEKLTDIIENPKTGLKVMLANDEQALVENVDSQKKQTADRTEENLDYQKNIANLVEAETLLKRAVQVLKAYYSKIIKAESFLDTKKQPEPPETWEEGGYKGQSGKGGTDAITMIEHILSESQTEEKEAHATENAAQHDYEDSMELLKKEEKELEENIAKLRVTLTETEEELLGKKSEHKATVEEKEAIEAYLLKIKPGCDFITENIETRKANRKDEEEALKGAVKLLKASPAYQTWATEDHNETLGDCLSSCTGNEEHAKCKACLAKVSIPGYCAGHPGTEGC